LASVSTASASPNMMPNLSTKSARTAQDVGRLLAEASPAQDRPRWRVLTSSESDFDLLVGDCDHTMPVHGLRW
jgi:hypothetical protein